MDCSLPGSSVHGILQAKNTGVDYHALLQGIFPTQVWNPSLFMFPSLAGRFFTTSATWEGGYNCHLSYIDIPMEGED